MAIKLLCAYGIYPCAAIVSLSPANEAGLIGTGLAETNLLGGIPYDGPRDHMWVEPAAVEPAQA